ncbi:hypothetical protein RAS2_11700 [Phycisphaerae bacterium RAS2]|nr:hypothetical protein RAS2_11700 [Phycisphaerae bacterium RAS2]
MDMERLREIIGEDRTDAIVKAPGETTDAAHASADSAITNTRAGERTVRDSYCHKLYEVRIGWLGCATVILVTIIVGVFVGFTSNLYPNVPPFVRGLTVGILVAILIAIIMRVVRGSETAQIEKLLNGSETENPIHTLIAIKSKYYFSNDNRVLGRVMTHFMGQGMAGSVFRLYKKNKPAPIDPLCIPFEPMLVNEGDAPFRELASHAKPNTPASQLQLRKAIDIESRLPPAIHRNIRLRGGYFLMAIGLFNLIFPIIESIQLGRPTFMLFFWCAWIVIMYLMPAAYSNKPKQQWLIVPGGLVMRQPTKRGNIDLQVFNAARCILLSTEARNRLWTINVADGQSTGWLRVTDFEMDLVLRAWCSPIPPPTVEQLSDFR